jgi:hypothetical protein
MQRAKIAPLAGLLTAIVLLTAGAGSGAAATAKLDLSTPAAVDAYLLSQGVNPATVVKQIGLKNYAGPASGCPGVGWNCTTATQVAQIASAGGENRASCTGVVPAVTPSSQSCLILQGGPTNHAECKQRLTSEPDAEQHCTITQSGTQNSALVDQTIDQGTNSTQQGTQTANVTQSDEKGHNDAQVHQTVQQSTKTGMSQVQDAHQVAFVVQDATGAGKNDSHVHQAQKQSAVGAPGQSQNTAGLPSGVVDCAFSPGSPSRPNACASVSQTTDDGVNNSHLHQLGNQDARHTSVSTQTQGTETGGYDGQVEQKVTGTGSSANHALQKERQLESAAALSVQTQFDPTGCCGISQTGGTNNSENIDQEAAQSASESGADQFATLTGSSNTPGSCDIRHHARNNDASTSFSDGEEPCEALIIQTTCTSGIEGGSCSSETLEPPSEESLFTFFATTPTRGADIPPLDVLAEPSSYTG